MRIAQVAPLYESVPPKYYGGTERIVSYLTEALVRQGHDVTLFASGDSRTQARLEAVSKSSLRFDADCVDSVCHHVLLAEQVHNAASAFDAIHWHADYFGFSLARRCRTPVVVTLHGRLDLPDLVPLYREFRDVPLVSISQAQREPLPWANWCATVHHGLPTDLYALDEHPADYLAFLGRISPEKRVDLAIEIARQADREIRIAAKIDKVDREYFQARIEPLFRLPHVTYMGEVGEAAKREFLGCAAGLLFPIDWPEPFGLVMIEAMACGTPVIAFRRASVPEVIDESVTGFVCSSVEEAAEAVGRLRRIDRARCRAAFERRFSVERMARDYLHVYDRLIGRGEQRDGRDHPDQESVLHPRHLAAGG